MHINRIIAAFTALSITASISAFAYNLSPIHLEQFFSFDALSLSAKVILACAMISLIFVARPRASMLRLALGSVATGVLLFAAYGAFASTLPLGDALIFFFGSLIAMTESLEATLPRRKPQARRRQITIQHYPTAKASS